MSRRWAQAFLLVLLLVAVHWTWGLYQRACVLERQRDEQRLISLVWQLRDEYQRELAASRPDATRIEGYQSELTRLVANVDGRRDDLSRVMQYGQEALVDVRSGRAEEGRALLQSQISPACERLAAPLPGIPAQPSRHALELESLLLAVGALMLLLMRSQWVAPEPQPAPLPAPGPGLTDRVLRSLSELLIVVGPDGLVRSANGVACRTLGYTEEELVGRPFSSLLLNSANPAEMGSCRSLEAVYQARDGSPVAVLMSCSVVSGPNGELTSVVTLSQDITQRKQAEDQLTVKEEALRRLVDRLVTVQDEERRAVARELHDGMLQYVIAADLQLQVFKKRGGEENLSRAVDYLKSSVEEGRRLIYDLRPSALEQLGLVETLRRQLEEVGWQVQFHDGLEGKPVPPALETSLYRIAGECLSNARRHSGSQRVACALERNGQEIRLEFQDWGKGFDPDHDAAGVGLESMRERVELLRGWLEITSQPGEGTLVRVGLPLP